MNGSDGASLITANPDDLPVPLTIPKDRPDLEALTAAVGGKTNCKRLGHVFDSIKTPRSSYSSTANLHTP